METLKNALMGIVILCYIFVVSGCQDDVSVEPTAFDWLTATQEQKEVAFEQHYESLTPELQEVLDWTIDNEYVNASPLSLRIERLPFVDLNDKKDIELMFLQSFESDMLVPLDKIMNDKSKKNVLSKMYRTSSKVYRTNTVIVNVISHQVPTQWMTALSQAVSHWSSIDGGLSFSIQGSGNYKNGALNVYYYNTNKPSSTIATTAIPSNGYPGRYMIINPGNDLPNSSYKRKLAMIHEIGHAIGLDHIDNPFDAGSYQLYTGNWSYDYLTNHASIMRENLDSKCYWSIPDRLAYQKLYP